MNKKEINEMKRAFRNEGGDLLIRKVAQAYLRVNSKGELEVLGLGVKDRGVLPEDKVDLLVSMSNKGLTGAIGEKLLEYRFDEKGYEEGGGQERLYSLLKSGLEDEDLLTSFTRDYALALNLRESHVLSIIYFTYLIKDKNKEEGREEEFIFILTNPVSKGDREVVYDQEKKDLVLRTDFDTKVSSNPTSGIFFPRFNFRAADVNGLLYYSKSKEILPLDLLRSFLGCELFLAPAEEEQVFLNLAEGFRLNRDFETLRNFNKTINGLIALNKEESEPDILTGSGLKRLFIEAGIPEEDLEEFDEAFGELVPGGMIRAENIAPKKLKVKSKGINTSIDWTSASQATIEKRGGRKYLVLELEEESGTVDKLDLIF